jgi:Crp-like helix-turn-helix domain
VNCHRYVAHASSNEETGHCRQSSAAPLRHRHVHDDDRTPQRVLPKISQETLAEMVGTTRSRVNVFMNKFRKLGFIKYNGTLTVDSSLLSVVLHD